VLHWCIAAAGSSPQQWLSAVDSLLHEVPTELKQQLKSICVSGTSATCLLVDRNCHTTVTRGPAMYNFNVLLEQPQHGKAALEQLQAIAPTHHTSLTGTSALMKLLTWHHEAELQPHEVLCHQADYVSAYIRGTADSDESTAATTDDGNTATTAGDTQQTTANPIVSDWNNALKAGFDVELLQWPDWLLSLGASSSGSSSSSDSNSSSIAQCLPLVLQPGAVISTVGAAFAERHSIPADCIVAAGTTDSIAAFLAAGVHEEGAAVTSLGSTIALKLLSTHRVEDASRGVYRYLTQYTYIKSKYTVLQ
jgi:D-ribulokinase